MRIIPIIIAIASLLAGCNPSLPEGTFGYDVDFLEKHQKVILLEENDGLSQLAVLPEYQGRVMTSSADGLEGKSYGWINYDLIESGTLAEHMNPFGGEDRFWMGPEGGQYAIFFEKGVDFTFENWYTPPSLDTEPFTVTERTEKEVVFNKKVQLTNYQGYTFDIEIIRKVAIFSREQVEKELQLSLGEDLYLVGYESDNTIVNSGSESWSKDTGLLSIWILGMFNPSPSTTVIIPYQDSLRLNTAYFGTIPPEKLTITDQHVMYTGDGDYRFKIGLPPENIRPYIGSYDASNEVLTIVSYTFNRSGTYVNSVWGFQDQPYEGDVINSYNDGPLATGEQLGPFYELESSSDAEELRPGEKINHIHQTYHFEGNFDQLNAISKTLLGMDLTNLKQ